MNSHCQSSVILALALCAVAGCCKRDDQVPSATTPAAVPAATNPAASQVPAAGQVIAVQASSDAGRDYMNQKLETVSTCNAESVNGAAPAGPSVIVSKSRPVRLSGWASDKKVGKVPDTLQLGVQSKDGQAYYATVPQNVPRHDIGQALGPAHTMSGYAVLLSINALSPGEYRVATIMASGGVASICPTAFSIVVTD
jgi:hypothetical protein